MGVYGIGVLEKQIHDRCYNTRGYNYWEGMGARALPQILLAPWGGGRAP